MKKIIFITIILIVITAGLIGSFVYFGGKITNAPSGEKNNQIIGGDRDEHGCIGSAGYQWCEPKNKCLRIWEEACYANSEQEIRYLLAEKYNKPIADVSVRVDKKTVDYMSGAISFAAKGLPAGGGGGMFLAAKDGNSWTLVFDGNGSVDCIKIKQQYNFPADMLKNFCDS